jgi:hypothetical protein
MGREEVETIKAPVVVHRLRYNDLFKIFRCPRVTRIEEVLESAFA